MSRSDIRALLARYGLRAHRDRGQNFLVAEDWAEKLVALSGVTTDESVLEIGTGLGILTCALAQRVRRVVSIEIDAGLVRLLRTERVLPENVELLHADALAVDLAALCNSMPSPVSAVANLPYAVSAPLLRRLLDLRGRLRSWSVMVQREVGKRLVAGPGSRDYGSLSVLYQLSARVEERAELHAGYFFPAPQVSSVFLCVQPRLDVPLADRELVVLERLLRAAFGHRRKTLRNALRAAETFTDVEHSVLESAWTLLGVDPGVRPETLAPEIYRALARQLAEVSTFG